MSIEAVIFDLDGTLLNTICDIGDSLNYILQNHGFPCRSYEEYVTFVCNGSKKLVERAAEKASAEEVEIILSEYKKYYSDNYSVKTVPYEGISELLKTLCEEGIKLGVYSNKPNNIVKDLCEKHFGGVFAAVRGQTDSVPEKPAPDGAWLTADEMGVEYEKCAFVGDSLEDRLTAIKAGMIPVSVTWGYRSADFLKENGADLCSDTCEELLQIILNL